ncbi:MAG: hypothetical protein J6U53_03280 [Tidjanibacter sp.]|nr:hypothetical protein [Tidjanibacter sp.]
MKKLNIYITIALMSLLAISCVQPESIEFASSDSEITIDAVGGTRKIRISSDSEWVSVTSQPWITVSPANGRGSVDCKIIIDSALSSEARNGEVLIRNLKTFEEQAIAVTQDGFPYSIVLDEKEVKVADYDIQSKRNFSVTLMTNVDFNVEIPAGVRWLSNKSYEVVLNRGIRPRQVKLDFEWDINTTSEDRPVVVKFVPKGGETLSQQDELTVIQGAADPIEENTRKGDSVALIGLQRTLETLSQWDVSIPMERWSGVKLWEEGQAGYTPDKQGRVKSAQFFIYNTNEDIPFQVKYLTAAEELYFFGNSNTFLKNLHVGEYLTELTQLKRLTIGAHGLIELDENFAKLENLEYLDLGSNNFMKVPEVLTKENFPKLRTLILNANQRSQIYDLSNSTRTDLGGFIEEEEFPVHLLKWGLDTLNLSVNYLHNSLPTFEDDDEIEVYTEEDWAASNDTLPRMLVDRRIKKVMPKTKFFSINLNRMSGELPEWLLYHPMLDYWKPYSFIFPQEGKTKEGGLAGFSNEPANLNYYYDLYTHKNKPTGEEQ